MRASNTHTRDITFSWKDALVYFMEIACFYTNRRKIVGMYMPGTFVGIANKKLLNVENAPSLTYIDNGNEQVFFTESLVIYVYFCIGILTVQTHRGWIARSICNISHLIHGTIFSTIDLSVLTYDLLYILYRVGSLQRPIRLITMKFRCTMAWRFIWINTRLSQYTC